MYWLVNGSGEIAKSKAQTEFQEASEFRIDLAPPDPKNNEILEKLEINSEDITNNCQNIEALKINAFFAKRKTPLAGYGCTFLKEALANDLNPYLLPAIAQKESSGGKTTPKFGGFESHNAWGWAVFDDKNKTLVINNMDLGKNEISSDSLLIDITGSIKEFMKFNGCRTLSVEHTKPASLKSELLKRVSR